MRELFQRLLDWTRRDRLDAELSEELSFHRQLLERDARDAGTAHDEADWVARRRLGNATAITEAARDRWSLPALDHLQQDVRWAWRALRRSPGFSFIAILTLSLGIASTTAVFSVFDSIILRGLPYRDADRIAAIYELSDDGNVRTPSYPTFADWQVQSATVSDAIEGFAFIRGDGVKIDDHPERRIAAYVTPGFFPLLGTRPAYGRVFIADEEKPGAPRVTVLSWQLFVEQFGGDPSIVGRTIKVDGQPTTIIGVMPHAFAIPNFAGSGWIPSSLWQPITIFAEANPERHALRGFHADSRTIVKLREGADSLQVNQVMRTIQQRLAAEYPNEQARWTSVVLQPLDNQIYGNLRQMLVILSAAIAFVLLLACANVSNLFLVRASVRSRELAVRAALGAGQMRLMRQALAESLLLAAASGAAGTLLAAALVGFVRRSATGLLPFASQLQLDARITAFAVALSAVTAVVIALLPGLRSNAGDLMRRLRITGSTGLERREGRLRYGLVSLQFALAVTLLVSAGLLIQSFRRIASVPLGFDPRGLVFFAIEAPRPRYEKPADAAALYARIIDGLGATPGVSIAAAAGGALMPTPVFAEGTQDAVTQRALYHPVSTGFLAAMRAPLIEGRWFSDADMRAATGFVINQRLAKALAPAGSALGTRITVRRSSQARADFGAPITLPVIGVVGDMRQSGPTSDSSPEVFLPYTLEVWPWMTFVVRSAAPATLLPAVERVVRDAEPGIEFLSRPSVMRAGVTAVDAQRRFFTLVLGGFAGAALLLACVGLYSIVAYGVAQRSREFGVRIALGAPRRSVIGLVLRDGAGYVAAGAGLGLFGAWAGTRLIRGLLFETSPADPMTIVAIPLVLAGVAVVALYVPARRATRSDPMSAIRAD